MIDYTTPDKPRGRLQKCRLTEKGKDWLEKKIIRETDHD